MSEDFVSEELSEAEYLFEKAARYRALLKSEFVVGEGTIESEVAAEVKAFLQGKLEEALGLRTRPPLVNQTFTPDPEVRQVETPPTPETRVDRKVVVVKKPPPKKLPPKKASLKEALTEVVEPEAENLESQIYEDGQIQTVGGRTYRVHLAPYTQNEFEPVFQRQIDELTVGVLRLRKGANQIEVYRDEAGQVWKVFKSDITKPTQFGSMPFPDIDSMGVITSQQAAQQVDASKETLNKLL